MTSSDYPFRLAGSKTDVTNEILEQALTFSTQLRSFELSSNEQAGNTSRID
jgi:hypothetical protein